MHRTGLTIVGLMIGVAALAGCSDDKAKDSSASPSTVVAGDAAVSTGGDAEVTVGGNALAGLDTSTVSCVKSGGKINIGSGAAGPQQAVAVILTDEATPKVESLAMMVDGNALAVSDMMGVKTGSGTVAVDGSTYTITGEAQGADMKNPMAGMITKTFTIKVTC